jgi:hypothetical protein
LQTQQFVTNKQRKTENATAYYSVHFSTSFHQITAMGSVDLYTRGGPGQPDTRGQSMVAKHADKLQKEKEDRAMGKLRLLLPQLTPATHAVALQECEWDDERALQLLRRFQTAKAEDLEALRKQQKRHVAKLAEKRKRSQHAESSSPSSDNATSSSSASGSRDTSSTTTTSDESNSSGSSDQDEGRRRKRKAPKRSPSRKEAKTEHLRESSPRRSSDKKRRMRKDDHRDRKKEKSRSKRSDSKRNRKHRHDSSKEKKKSKERRRRRDRAKVKDPIQDSDRRRGGTAKRHSIQEYGKHGIIRETDMYSKRPEFMLWAMDVKHVDVEAIPNKFEERELFRTYIEDYNTGTLPHRKYYDLEAYERHKATRKATKGLDSDLVGGEIRMLDDEAERRRELLQERQKQQAERLRAAYEELQTTDKAEAMRQQELLRAKMALAYRTGDQKEAQRLAERLKPDDQRVVPAREPAAGS